MPASREEAPGAAELPDLAPILGRVLARVARERQPLLVALAERMAAERYRVWAREVGDPEHAARLRACAEREEEIAARVEGLYPDAAELEDEVRAAVPDLRQITRAVFAGRALLQQLAIQARGERLGASTWRAFAAEAEGEHARAAFQTCAELEEASAAVIDVILGGR